MAEGGAVSPSGWSHWTKGHTMCDRTDLELRVYLTGRADGSIEWQVFVHDEDGQTAWQDGDISTWKQGGPVVPSMLKQCVQTSLRHLCFKLRA